MMRAISFVAAAAVLATAALSGQGGRGGQATPASGVAGAGDTPRYVLRRLPQPSREGRWTGARVTLARVHEQRDVWEKSLRKLRGRLMPPPGSRQPTSARSTRSSRGWRRSSTPPSAAGRRRPRAGAAADADRVRDGGQRPARASSSTPTQLLPAEIEVNGFDNIATALSVSPAFLDQYVAAARLAAKLAVGDPMPKVTSAAYPQPVRRSAGARRRPAAGHARRDEVPPHTSPPTASTAFTILDLGVDLYSRVARDAATRVVLLVDGREVFRESLGGTDDLRTVDRQGAPGRAEVMKRFANVPVQVKAGTYDVAVTFIERARVESDEFVG